MKIVLEAVTGSYAYGLNTPTSDLDTLGIFVYPIEAYFDLGSHPDVVSTASPVGDDATHHELRKAMRQALKSSPTMSELLWAEEFTVIHPAMTDIVENRSEYLSAKHVRHAYLGCARNHLDAYTGTGNVKKARNALRYAEVGYELYTEGILNVRLSDPQKYFDLSEMSTGEVLDILTKAIIKLDNPPTSALREFPNYDLANALTINARVDLLNEL